MEQWRHDESEIRVYYVSPRPLCSPVIHLKGSKTPRKFWTNKKSNSSKVDSIERPLIMQII